MIEEWITDAYCIYESIKPHCAKCMASYCEMKYRKSCQRVQFEKLESHDQKAL